MKNKVDIKRQRLFLLFLLIAVALWYVNKLAYTYKTEIEIPVELVFDFNSLGWVENPTMKIKCLAEGKGTELFRYSFGLIPAINIPMGSLVLDKVSEEDYYQINSNSLREAMRIAHGISQNNLHVIQILDTIPWIKVDRIESAILPVKSNVDIDCEKQFMVIGQVKMQPSQISVRAPKSVLDTMKYILTERVAYRNLNKSVNAGVGLIIPEGVTASDTEIRFMADVAGYTELEYRLEVNAENLPIGMSVMPVPNYVTAYIKVPLKSFKSDDDTVPGATINYGDREHQRGNFFKVKVVNLPEDGAVTSIVPEYVELFFTNE